MNCEQFNSVVHEIARDEPMGADALESALKHAHDCDECNERLEEAELLSADLRSLADHYASEEAPYRVELALMRKFDRKKKLTSRAGILRLLTFAGAGSVAAAGLLMFAMLHRPPAAETAPTPAPNRVKVPTINRNGPVAISAQNEAFAAVDASSYSQDVWMSALSNNSAAPDAFVPLTESFDSGSVDAENVVRVAMSRTALRKLGLYLDQSSEGSDEQVVADLVVSSDGTPQAIRVVNW